MKKKIIVVIPVYKPIHKLNEFEILSIKNTKKKLDDLALTFIGPSDIKNQYIKYFPNILYETYSNRYFKSIKGYNILLKSRHFYYTFQNYDYMLIVQTDAWIFGNSEMLFKFFEWDFVGAPSFHNNELLGFNGGLSLRNIKKSHKMLKLFRYINKPYKILKLHLKNQNLFKVIFYKWFYIFMDLTFKNNIMYPLNLIDDNNEDLFWSSIVPTAECCFKVVPYHKSIEFSWEHNLENLFSNSKLPFGVHGWWNYNKIFYESHLDSQILKDMGLEKK